MMKYLPVGLKPRLYLLAAGILLSGLGSSLLLYLTAAATEQAGMVQDFENSKNYRHALEVYGGKMSIFADQFSRWFAGLWHGESLAVTIACIAGFLALAVFLVAMGLPDDAERQKS